MKDINVSLYCSTRENSCYQSKSFWEKLANLANANILRRVGFSVLTPYGLSYRSKNFSEYLTRNWTEHFFEHLADSTSKVAPDRKPVAVIWLSTLFNTFFAEEHCRQRNSSLEDSDSYICPNNPAVIKFLASIISEILLSNWFCNLKEKLRTAFLFDMAQFEDPTFCFCGNCKSEFKLFLESKGINKPYNGEEIIREIRKNAVTNPMHYYLWTMFRENSIVVFLNKLIMFLANQVPDPADRYTITRYKEFLGENGIVEATGTLTGQSLELLTNVDALSAIDFQMFPISGGLFPNTSGDHGISPSDNCFPISSYALQSVRRTVLKYMGLGYSKQKAMALLLEGGFSGKDNLENVIKVLSESNVKNIAFMPFDPDNLNLIVSTLGAK
jgi:hypothetical protein